MPTVTIIKKKKGAPRARRIGPMTQAQAARATKRTAKRRVVKAKRAPRLRSQVGPTIDFSAGRLMEGLAPIGTRRDTNGKHVHMYRFSQIVSSVISDASALLGTATSTPTNTGIVLNTALFDRILTLAPAYDRCRLASLKFKFEPSVGTAKDGKAWWYFDYAGDNIVTTANAVSKMEDVRDFVPFKESWQTWKKQDPEDLNWVKTATTNSFNSANTHKLYLFGRGFLASTEYGYIWATGVVEFTGAQ